jgi:hypothetical protein
MTTGAVTRPKVIPRKAGVKSIFHQVIGAVIVEFDKDGDIFCRRLPAAAKTDPSTTLFLASVQRPETKTIVVESNHDLALERYVREGRYRMDGINVLTGLQLETRYLQYRELVGQKLDAHEPVPSFSLLEYAVRLVAGETVNGVEWVHDGKSRVINGVECGHHGFRGANGAKGTVSGFARLGRKMSIGDKHTPEIDDGVYVAGVAELQHGYNKGPSGWCRSLIVQYRDGKRTLVTLQNGEKWRA